jgi:hypothetical protein
MPGSSGFPSFRSSNPVSGFPSFCKNSPSRRKCIEGIVKVKLRVCKPKLRKRNHLKNGGMLAHLHVQFFAGASSLVPGEAVPRMNFFFFFFFWQLFPEVSRRESMYQVGQGRLVLTTQVQGSREFYLDYQTGSGPALTLDAES